MKKSILLYTCYTRVQIFFVILSNSKGTIDMIYFHPSDIALSLTNKQRYCHSNFVFCLANDTSTLAGNNALIVDGHDIASLADVFISR